MVHQTVLGDSETPNVRVLGVRSAVPKIGTSEQSLPFPFPPKVGIIRHMILWFHFIHRRQVKRLCTSITQDDAKVRTRFSSFCRRTIIPQWNTDRMYYACFFIKL